MNYASYCQSFDINEISEYLAENIQVARISRTSLSWYLNKLTNEKRLVRIGRGRYEVSHRKDFVPIISEDAKSIYSLLSSNSPFAHFCIYEGMNITIFQHHLSSNSITYIETERYAMESVFHFLKDKDYVAYLKPDEQMIDNYIDLSKKAYFVKPLISESPLQSVQGVMVPTIEKLLVDIFTDKDFYYLQGLEWNHIFENVYSQYNINISKMLRYAGRRGVRKEIREQILMREI